MTHITENRIAEQTTTAGTGALALAAVPGYRRFGAKMAVNDTCHYLVEAVDSVGRPTGEYEFGIGTYSTTNTLARTTVVGSSNADGLVNFGVGTKRVTMAVLAPTTAPLKSQWVSAMAALPNVDPVVTGASAAVMSLSASNGYATLRLKKSASGKGSLVEGYVGELPRWVISLGDEAAEQGAAEGSNLQFARFNNAGAYIDSPITVLRGTGDLYTKRLVASSANPQLAARATVDSASIEIDKIGNSNAYLLGKRDNKARWAIELGGSAPETGGNAGSDFSISRYSDAGSWIDTPLWINRSSGQIYANKTVVSLSGAASGFQVEGFNTQGTIHKQFVLAANPSWNGISIEAVHERNVWAGWRLWVPNNTFDFQNDGSLRLNGAVVQTSDIRVKSNIEVIDDPLEVLNGWSVASFERTDLKALDGTPVRQCGHIAQWIEKKAPAGVIVRDKPTPENPDPQRRVDYSAVAAIAAAGVDKVHKKLLAHIADQATTIQALIARVEALEAVR